MLDKIKEFSELFLEKTKNQEIIIIHHFDTDGITSGAIMGRCLKKLDRKFSIKTIKGLEDEFIDTLPKNKILLFVDLASGSLKKLSTLSNEIFIIDHHELSLDSLPENIHIFNWHLYENGENMCSAATAYLITKKLTGKIDQESATLAIIGTVGDMMEKDIGPLANESLKDSEVKIKKGFLIYPSTRPLNKALEYCSNPYIPGVTGNYEGATTLLREAGIEFTKLGYKALIDLNEEEMQRLVTSIALRVHSSEVIEEFLGNLFLVKFFNKLEDARELSALINACSRMGHSHIALLFCMGNKKAKEQADKIYIKYKQSIVSGLRYVDSSDKIEGKQYILLNARDNIQDTIIGTIASILSMSNVYEEGKIIIAMAYNADKIKVSARIAGRGKGKSRSGYNLKDVMGEITELTGGVSGGHEFAAGCLISKDQEKTFIDLVRKKLDLDIVRVQ